MAVLVEVVMSSSEPARLLAKEDLGEATIIRILVPRLCEPKQLEAFHETLGRLADDKNSRLILDLSAVEFLPSACIGWFLKLRQQLRLRGRHFQPPCQRRGLFAFFADAKVALEAIRLGESDPLLLCGVRPEVMEVLVVC
jgi:hypothetical protein